MKTRSYSRTLPAVPPAPAPRPPKILLLDLETSHNIVATFDLWPKEPIPHANVLKERYVILACWQFYGEQRIQTAVSRRPFRDKSVCEALARAIAQADVVVAHNGRRFDLPFLRARALRYGITVPPVVEIDTLSIARRVFRFNSNRLDYLGRYIGYGQKAPHSGGLWLTILQGPRRERQRALRQMADYCAQDIKLLRAWFTALRPYLSQAELRKLHTIRRCRVCKGIARIPLPKRTQPGRCRCGNWQTT